MSQIPQQSPRYMLSYRPLINDVLADDGQGNKITVVAVFKTVCTVEFSFPDGMPEREIAIIPAPKQEDYHYKNELSIRRLNSTILFQEKLTATMRPETIEAIGLAIQTRMDTVRFQHSKWQEDKTNPALWENVLKSGKQ